MASLRSTYDSSPSTKRRGMTISNHRKQALHLLSQALRCEEQHLPEQQEEVMDNRLVLSLYKLGVKELDSALKLLVEDLRNLDVESVEYSECVSLRDDLAKARMNARERMNKLNVDIVMEEAARKGRDKLDRIRMDSIRSINGSPYRQQQRDRAMSPGSPASLQRQKRIAPTPPRPTSSPRNAHSTKSNTKVKQYEGSNCNSSDQFEDQARSMKLTLTRSAKGRTSLDQVVGHAKAKEAIRESVILPSLRPELFCGLLSPPRGILLFGPPGNGKTMLARALAEDARCKSFFNATAAALTSRYVGEGEKMVRALFSVAAKEAPAIVFIDEIDSLLSDRSSGEHSADRRIKNEFFSSVDGLISGASSNGVLVVAATNRPQEIDEAALRRFTKRIYIPMPELEDRKQLLTRLLVEHGNPLSEKEVSEVAKLTVGYSCSDLTNLARDAAMGPIRDIPRNRLMNVRKEELRGVSILDFRRSLERIRPSVGKSGLALYEEWNGKYGDVS